MTHRFTAVRCCALAGFLLAALLPAGRAAERESNFWPVLVRHRDEAGNTRSWTAAGPLVFSRPTAEGGRVAGVRPFWVQTTDEDGELRAALGLHPLFTWRGDHEDSRWNVFQLIKQRGRREDAPLTNHPPARDEAFEIWPFWWSRQTGDPDTSYRALFPIAGTLKRRLGFERISWAPFPLFVRTEERGATTTHVPWPFLRITRGAAQGFGVWPLFGHQERPEGTREAFYLWPFGYDRVTPPGRDAPPEEPPQREVGALPLYARSSGPGYRSESYLWPLFGYTDRTAPDRYHETRYFWPFLVQGRGDAQYVNRWGPFYTHSIRNGQEKTWIAWPLYRRIRQADDVLVQTKHQVGIFLYWSLEQRSADNPDLASAHVRHLWPLYSAWDNGAGRRQFQFPSPLEVFFPGNENIRQAWAPLFSLYRHESRAPGHFRASLLWDGITWEHDREVEHREFHLGPLLTYARDTEEMKFELAHGLLGVHRTAAGRSWRILWFKIPPRARKRPARRPTRLTSAAPAAVARPSALQ